MLAARRKTLVVRERLLRGATEFGEPAVFMVQAQHAKTRTPAAGTPP